MRATSIRCPLATERTKEQDDISSHPAGDCILPVTLDYNETQWILHFDGDLNMTFAVQLKQMLVEGCASGKELHLDLESVQQIDIAILQLLWTAAREAARLEVRVVSHLSEAVSGVAHDAGFEGSLGELDPATGIQSGDSEG